MKQYHEDGHLWEYMIENDYRCDCSCNVFHKEYNKVRHKIWYICNSCGNVVGELKDEYLQEALNTGIWK